MLKTDHEHGASWQRIREHRQTTDSTQAKSRTKIRTIMIAVSYLLLFGVFWSVYAIYVPVLRAEFGYIVNSASQSKQGGEWWNWLVPDFSFDLIPDVIASEWGLVIPKIFLQEKVVANVDASLKQRYMPALNVGIAHAAGTVLPGEGGLGYYFAHSSGMNMLAPQKEATFYLLGKLSLGDEVWVYNFGKKFTYQVVETKIVEASDLSFLENVDKQETIVLQTCWPVGTSAKRLLVFAKRV
jgi:LPXTG-site transpeptidase (sortase) family protein